MTRSLSHTELLIPPEKQYLIVETRMTISPAILYEHPEFLPNHANGGWAFNLSFPQRLILERDPISNPWRSNAIGSEVAVLKNASGDARLSARRGESDCRSASPNLA